MNSRFDYCPEIYHVLGQDLYRASVDYGSSRVGTIPANPCGNKSI